MFRLVLAATIPYYSPKDEKRKYAVKTDNPQDYKKS